MAREIDPPLQRKVSMIKSRSYSFGFYLCYQIFRVSCREQEKAQITIRTRI